MSRSAGPARLKMEGICKRFGPTLALQDVDLTVARGEVHGLVGENGAGKSTLMKILAGVYPPDSGKMWLNGVPYSPRNPADGRSAEVAMIYQELSLAPHLSIAENILLGTEPTRNGLIDWKQMYKSAAEAMARLGLSHLDPARRTMDLSPAEQQLVEVARSLAVGAQILVLDEPTSSLSQTGVERLFSLIRNLKAQDISIVYISHFLEEVQEITDRFTVLRDGKLSGEGNSSEVSIDRIASLMVGRQLEELYPRSPRKAGETLLKVSGLKGPQLLSSVDLEVRRGEVTGIAGLVGAGRTELVRCLFGLASIREGRIRMLHLEGEQPPSRRWRQGVGMVSEDRKGEGLALSLPVADNLTLTHLKDLGPFGLITKRQQEKAADRWAQELNIRCESVFQPTETLSGGNQQKIALARLLYHDVDLLLLDEPTRGIDVGSKAQIYQMVDRLASGKTDGKPKAILIISSYLPELLGVCDRLAVMFRGRLLQARPIEAWSEHEVMLAATGSQQ